MRCILQAALAQIIALKLLAVLTKTTVIPLSLVTRAFLWCVAGTLVSAWTPLCGCKTRLASPAKAVGLNLLAAFLQMVTFVLIVGWVWSIIWGMNFVQIASKVTARLSFTLRADCK